MTKALSHEEEGLAALLLNTEGARQAVLLDLDGTVHAGMFRAVSRNNGVSNMDLGVLLLFSLQPGHLEQLPRFINRGAKLFRMHLAGAPEPDLIRYFTNECLQGIDAGLVNKTGDKLPMFSYSHAKQCISELSKYNETIIISKALQPAVNGYIHWFENHHATIKGDGNKLRKSIDGKILGLDESHTLLTAGDKQQYAASMLANCNPKIERAIIFGDSIDDFGTYEAASDLLGEKNCYVFGMNTKSEKVRAASVRGVNSWQDIHSIIFKPELLPLS